MATLHQAIDTTRSALKWVGIMLGGFLLLITIIRGGAFLKEMFFPTPAPAPTVRFGVLPKLSFPENSTSNNLFYSIDTVTGFLPTFSDRVNVYQITHEEPNLLDLKRARSIASAVGIGGSEKKISDTVYSWSVKDLFSRKIVLDIVSRNFIYTTDFLSYAPLVVSRQSIEQSDGVNAATKFLISASSFPSTIDRSKTKTSNYKIENGKLVAADNISETQIVRVDFFLADIDKMPIFSSSPINSTINLLVSNFDNNTVVEADYYQNNITKVMSTYPIKTTQEAYAELTQGKAYIAANFNPIKDIISIRKVFLAYYLDDKKTDYLMPIIVFTDDDGFYAYVSAVEDNWVK